MNENISTVDWPPTYSIKKHRRARYVKLRAIPSQGLVLTVPYRFNIKEIPAILEEHKVWIIKQLTQLQTQPIDVLPDKIELHALNETWLIHYVECNTKLEIVTRPGHELVLVGNSNKKLYKEKLVTWIKDQAKIHLVAQLTLLSEQLQLFYDKVIIRDQKTLWGSCTSKKLISLNYKLLFLPPHLVAHIIIHELCHTKYLNHSQRFWKLVEKHDQHWEKHRRELRRANDYIPIWIND